MHWGGTHFSGGDIAGLGFLAEFSLGVHGQNRHASSLHHNAAGATAGALLRASRPRAATDNNSASESFVTNNE